MPVKTRMPKIGIVCCVFLLFALCQGCGEEPPKRNEIVGKWTCTKASARHFSSAPNITTMTIEFFVDGSFVASNFPEKILRFSSPTSQFIQGKGNWSLSGDTFNVYETESVVEMRFEEYDGQSGLPTNLALNIEVDKKSLLLFTYLGDPDQEERVEYSMSFSGPAQ